MYCKQEEADDVEEEDGSRPIKRRTGSIPAGGCAWNTTLPRLPQPLHNAGESET